MIAAPGPESDAVPNVTVIADEPFPVTVINGAEALVCALKAPGVVPATTFEKSSEPVTDNVKP